MQKMPECCDNVAFYHTKLESDVCPRVDNQTTGIRVNSVTSGKTAIGQLSKHATAMVNF